MRVNIKVKDVNDNSPDFATNNEVLMCETVMPGKVRLSVLEFVHVCLAVYAQELTSAYMHHLFIRTTIY